MRPNCFYMVWNPAGRAPTYRHDSFASAKIEAERLARQHAGCTFVVLQSCGEIKVNDVQWTGHGHNADDEIPF